MGCQRRQLCRAKAQESCQVFKGRILQVQKQSVLVPRKMNRWVRRLPWLNRELIAELQRKKASERIRRMNIETISWKEFPGVTKDKAWHETSWAIGRAVVTTVVKIWKIKMCYWILLNGADLQLRTYSDEDQIRDYLWKLNPACLISSLRNQILRAPEPYLYSRFKKLYMN